MVEFYIGLMSGSSLDGIDACLLQFTGEETKLIAADIFPFSQVLQRDLSAMVEGKVDSIHQMACLDQQIAKAFVEAVKGILQVSGFEAKQIRAIGCHGQTIRHKPCAKHPYTIQIGDPNTIAQATGIDVVTDFRQRDLCQGGQGAPLAPVFHQAIFAGESNPHWVLNIGGIANLTLIDPAYPLLGFDTGPGNALMNEWIALHQGKAYDEDGAWAGRGAVIGPLLEVLLKDPYFKAFSPKSTGRDYFSMDWLESFIQDKDYAAVDVQRTLLELTARSIVDACKPYWKASSTLWVCGGGVFNALLMSRLRVLFAPVTLRSMDDKGIDPRWVEAMAFAWLARMRVLGRSLSLSSVTGSKGDVMLGGMYLGRSHVYGEES